MFDFYHQLIISSVLNCSNNLQIKSLIDDSKFQIQTKSVCLIFNNDHSPFLNGFVCMIKKRDRK